MVDNVVLWKNREPKIINIFAIDLDGVIVSPYTYPARPFVGMHEELNKLWDNGKNILFLASFNPTAEQSIRNFGMDKMFSCFRSGANEPWLTTEYDDKNAKTMTKTAQILSMLKEYL